MCASRSDWNNNITFIGFIVGVLPRVLDFAVRFNTQTRIQSCLEVGGQ